MKRSAGIAVALFAWPCSRSGRPKPRRTLHSRSDRLRGSTTDVDTDSSKFREYRELPNGPVLSFLRSSGDQKVRYDVIVENGFENDRATASPHDLGRLRIAGDYNLIPHRFGNDGHTPPPRDVREAFSSSTTRSRERTRPLSRRNSRRTAPRSTFLFCRTSSPRSSPRPTRSTSASCAVAGPSKSDSLRTSRSTSRCPISRSTGRATARPERRSGSATSSSPWSPSIPHGRMGHQRGVRPLGARRGAALQHVRNEVDALFSTPVADSLAVRTRTSSRNGS